jgi:hypothetical protein
MPLIVLLLHSSSRRPLVYRDYLPLIFTLSELVSRTVHVDARHAVLEFRLYWRSSCLNELLTLVYIADSEMLYTMNAELADGSAWDAIAGIYIRPRTMVLHTNFPQYVSSALYSRFLVIARHLRHTQMRTNPRINPKYPTAIECSEF